jgi:hypothetical protein
MQEGAKTSVVNPDSAFEVNTDPIQDFDDQKLKKNAAENF